MDDPGAAVGVELRLVALFCLCGQQLKIHGETTITKGVRLEDSLQQEETV